MILTLDTIWFIDADTTNCILTERRVIQAKEEGAKGIAPKPENIGKTRDVQHGFYGNIAAACQGYLNKGVASMDGMLSATQVIAAWADMTARVEAACKPLRNANKLAPAEAEYKTSSSSVRIQGLGGTTIELPSTKGPEPLYALPQG